MLARILGIEEAITGWKNGIERIFMGCSPLYISLG
jgi:hypothetical protein